MDTKIEQYQTLIKQHLIEWAEFMKSQPAPNEEIALSLDDERQQYILVSDQWLRGQKTRSRYITLHVAIKNDKIWIEEDLTEEGIASFLLDNGVPSEDIVLGFQPPWLRSQTEVAIA